MIAMSAEFTDTTGVIDWSDAACLNEDPELFFPIGNGGPAQLQIEEAKQVCRRCDIREKCLNWALEIGQEHGVWGGLSEEERRALKRRNGRARVVTSIGRDAIQGVGESDHSTPLSA